MKQVKLKIKSNIIPSIIAIVLGLIMIIFPSISTKIICYIGGVVALGYGIYDIVKYVNKPAVYMTFIMGILKVAGGILLIVHPFGIVWILSIILGIALLIASIFYLRYAVMIKKLGGRKWIYSFIIGAATLILAILIIFFDKSTSAIIIMLGIGLIIFGIDLLLKENNKNKVKEKETIEVEAEEIE